MRKPLSSKFRALSVDEPRLEVPQSNLLANDARAIATWIDYPSWGQSTLLARTTMESKVDVDGGSRVFLGNGCCCYMPNAGFLYEIRRRIYAPIATVEKFWCWGLWGFKQRLIATILFTVAISGSTLSYGVGYKRREVPLLYLTSFV